MRFAVVVAFVVFAVAGCEPSEHREARSKFNEGVAALEKGDFEAAEKALLEARSTAGVDPELRFRAAYDLGMAYAAHSDRVKAGLAEKPGEKGKPDLQQALTLEQSALSWFADASRLRSDDADTKTNLAIVTARVQALSDELRKAEGTLEKRLDQVIAQQRGVLDGAREAWLAIKLARGADPLAQQAALTSLADRERGIVAEAGTITDLAADEIDSIGKKPDDKRDDKEKSRVVQLKNLDLYLIEARNKIADARRKLQELAAEDGLARAEEALAQLKRAREQLLDPIQVMQEIARDELAVRGDTETTQKLGSAGLKGAADGPAITPAWLEPLAIAMRQASLHERLDEVRARLEAGVENLGKEPAKDKDGNAKPVDPKQQKFLERIVAALPSVKDALTAMDKAHDVLVSKQLDAARTAETEVLQALTKAIEQFGDLKQTIELAYQHSQEALQLLGPDAAKQIEPKERGTRTRESVAGNLARVGRIKELLADEVANLKEPPADPKADPKQLDAAKQQLEQAKQQLARAEELRGQAETALASLDKAVTGGGKTDPMPLAQEADKKLDELRQIFFSVIEHLKELVRQQGETRDQTAQTSADDDFARKPKLPGLVQRETEHGGMAKAITDALAKQADEASKQAGQTQPGQGPDAKTLAQAADEVRKAQTDMTSAQHVLEKARDATQSSESIKPSVQSQIKAIEHLEEALKLLQPPQNGDNKQDQQQNQDKDKDKKDKDKDKQQQPQSQGGAGQRARDEDAARQRDRQKAHPSDEPVDKDW